MGEVTRDALNRRHQQHQQPRTGWGDRKNRRIKIDFGMVYYYICPPHDLMGGFPSVQVNTHFWVGPEKATITCLDPSNPVFQNETVQEILKKRDFVLPDVCPVDEMLGSEEPFPPWVTEKHEAVMRPSEQYHYMVIPYARIENDQRVLLHPAERVAGILPVNRDIDSEIVGVFQKRGNIYDPSKAVLIGVGKFKTPGGANKYKMEVDLETVAHPLALERPDLAQIRDLCVPGGECDPYADVAHYLRSAEKIRTLLYGAKAETRSAPKDRRACFANVQDHDPHSGYCQKCENFQDCAAAVAAKTGNKATVPATKPAAQAAAPAAEAPPPDANHWTGDDRPAPTAQPAPVAAPAAPQQTVAEAFLAEVAQVLGANPAHPLLPTLMQNVATGTAPAMAVAALLPQAPTDAILLRLLQQAAVLAAAQPAPAAQPPVAAPAAAPAAQPAQAPEPDKGKGKGKKAGKTAAAAPAPVEPPAAAPTPEPEPEAAPEPVEDPEEAAMRAEEEALAKRKADLEAKKVAKAAEAAAKRQPPADPAPIPPEPSSDGAGFDQDFNDFAKSFGPGAGR